MHGSLYTKHMLQIWSPLPHECIVHKRSDALAMALGCAMAALFLLAARYDETFVKSHGVAIKGSEN